MSQNKSNIAQNVLLKGLITITLATAGIETVTAEKAFNTVKNEDPTKEMNITSPDIDTEIAKNMGNIYFFDVTETQDTSVLAKFKKLCGKEKYVQEKEMRKFLTTTTSADIDAIIQKIYKDTKFAEAFKKSIGNVIYSPKARENASISADAKTKTITIKLDNDTYTLTTTENNEIQIKKVHPELVFFTKSKELLEAEKNTFDAETSVSTLVEAIIEGNKAGKIKKAIDMFENVSPMNMHKIEEFIGEGKKIKFVRSTNKKVDDITQQFEERIQTEELSAREVKEHAYAASSYITIENNEWEIDFYLLLVVDVYEVEKMSREKNFIETKKSKVRLCRIVTDKKTGKVDFSFLDDINKWRKGNTVERESSYTERAKLIETYTKKIDNLDNLQEEDKRYFRQEVQRIATNEKNVEEQLKEIYKRAKTMNELYKKQ